MGGIKHGEIRRRSPFPRAIASKRGLRFGRLADKSVLSERNQEREFPSQRKPLSEVAFNGKFIAG
jgi:hypothetical protein